MPPQASPPRERGGAADLQVHSAQTRSISLGAIMNVTVIGAGIGGLTTALSLHAAGIDVRVYESVAEMKAIGFGINLQPNAARELIELGLGEALAETAIETAQLGYYNKLGQLIWSEPRGRAAGYAWPQYAIERGDLQMILLDAVKARIGAENILIGHHLVSFEQDGSGVAAHFIERGSGRRLPTGVRRRVGGLRRHSFRRAGAALSGRGTAGRQRPGPMARRGRSRAIPGWPHARHDGL